MAIHKNKKSINGFTITELMYVLIVFTLLGLGIHFGAKFASDSFPDHKNESWFGLVVLVAGLVTGIIAVAVFIGSCMAIGGYLLRRKKKTNNENS